MPIEYSEEYISKVVEELLESQRTTLEYYYSIYDEEEDKRDALHDDIISRILGKRQYSNNRKVYMLGGAPANGKSSFLASGKVAYPPNALKVDPDEIKYMLPEYRYMLSKNIAEAAALVHEESSVISKALRRAALQKGLDIILDGIADDTLEKRKADLEELKMFGHSVRIDYVSLDTSLSLRLAELRFEKTGRRVPDFFVKEMNKKIAELIPQLIDSRIFDELYLWDTNLESEPRLILRQKNGNLEIENDSLFENFKQKVNYED